MAAGAAGDSRVDSTRSSSAIDAVVSWSGAAAQKVQRKSSGDSKADVGPAKAESPPCSSRASIVWTSSFSLVVGPVHDVLRRRERALGVDALAVLRRQLAERVRRHHQRDGADELELLLLHHLRREEGVDVVDVEEHLGRQLQLLVQLDQPVDEDAAHRPG